MHTVAPGGLVNYNIILQSLHVFDPLNWLLGGLGGACFLPKGGESDFILKALFTRCALFRFSRCAQHEKLAESSEKLATLTAPRSS